MNRIAWIKILIQYTLIRKQTYLCFSSPLFKKWWDRPEIRQQIRYTAHQFVNSSANRWGEDLISGDKYEYLFEPMARRWHLERKIRIAFLLFNIKNHKRLKNELQTGDSY